MGSDPHISCCCGATPWSVVKSLKIPPNWRAIPAGIASRSYEVFGLDLRCCPSVIGLRRRVVICDSCEQTPGRPEDAICGALPHRNSLNWRCQSGVVAKRQRLHLTPSASTLRSFTGVTLDTFCRSPDRAAEPEPPPTAAGQRRNRLNALRDPLLHSLPLPQARQRPGRRAPSSV